MKDKILNLGLLWWWFLLTSIYSIMIIGEGLIFDTSSQWYIQNGPTLLDKIYIIIAGIIGLFVPVGPSNWFLAIASYISVFRSLSSFLIFLVGTSIVVVLFRLKRLDGIKKMLRNLAILAVLTLTLDLATFGCFASLEIIYTAHYPADCAVRGLDF
jgi:hypothetical protein